MEAEIAPNAGYDPEGASQYRIARGQAFFLPLQEPDPKMSRRRRRRLRGKRKAGLLPPWGFAPLGDVESFTLSTPWFCGA